jgi:endonuclease/exonuclease/phosphatase family metal-dependent hydrolase
MKLFLIASMIVLMNSTTTENGQVKLISFNIRYGTAEDGTNSWDFRKAILFDFIEQEKADFLGLQEAMIFQIEEIIEKNPEYSYIGRTRQADGSSGEATPILYKPEYYELIRHETLWLSETPEVPESKSWDSSLPRIFTWAHFRRKKDDWNLIIYNTHYDHIGEKARFESSKVIVNHIYQHHKDKNIVLLGDFNAPENSDPVQYLTSNDKMPLQDSYRTLHKEKGEKDMTFYGWREHVAGTGRRIDYIFHAGNLKPVEMYVSNYNQANRYPSDHMPVVALFN